MEYSGGTISAPGFVIDTILTLIFYIMQNLKKTLFLAIAQFLAIAVMAQQAENKLWMATEMVVKSDQVPGFEESFREIVRLFGELDYPYPWITFQSNGFTYFYFVEMESLGDYDQIVEKSSETWKDIDSSVLGKFLSAIDSYKRFTISSMNEFSYSPENPRLASNEMNYAIWDVHYIKSGRESDYFESIREFKEKVMRYGYEDPIMFLQGGIGTDNPMYIGVLYGKDEIDFRQINKKMWDAFGEEGEEMYSRFRPLLRGRDMIEFWFRPDLSLSAD
jgi:hypothetical protein